MYIVVQSLSRYQISFFIGPHHATHLNYVDAVFILPMTAATTQVYAFLFQAKHAENQTAKHFNVDIAQYTLTVTCLPVNLLARWSCQSEVTKVRVDYEYVGSALSKPLPLTQLGILVPINGDVQQYHAEPNGMWSAEHKKLLWRMDELKSGAESKGALTAAFKVADGPSTPTSINVKFNCDGGILSGTEFVLKTNDYKVSFSRKQLFANFTVDSDNLV